VASTYYRRLDGLTPMQWLRSLRGVREGATWKLDDPLPFAVSMSALAHETLAGKWGRLWDRVRNALRERFAPAPRSEENAA
jgi:hypothetical protein